MDAATDVEAETEADADATAEVDGEAEAEADATVERCPDTLPTDGPVRLNLRWRRAAANDWNDLGSAALAVDGGVVLAAIPRAPAGVGTPKLVRLSATNGSPSLDGPAELVEFDGATALAAVADGPEHTLLAGAIGPGAADAILRARLLSSGVLRELVSHDVDVERAMVTTLRAAQDGEWIHLAAAGLASMEWALYAVSIPLGSGPGAANRLHDGAALGAESLVALAPGDDPPIGRIAWTAPLRISVGGPGGAEIVGQFLPTGSTLVPVATAQVGFLLAGRTEDPEVGIGMWVVRRGSYDLGLLAESRFTELEEQVDRPAPQALEPAGELFVLVWAADRDIGRGPVPSCLYLTPVDGDGRPAGTTLRIDPGSAEARASGVSDVRLVTAPEGLYLLLRQGADLWLARVDSAT